VRKLVAAGIETGVLVAPVIPGMSDDAEKLEAVTAACIDAGAVSVSAIALFLKPGVKEHWLEWLERERPELLADHRRRYARGSRLPKEQQAAISAIVGRVARTRAIDTADADLRRIAREQRLGPAKDAARPSQAPHPEPLTLL
jgi:DNA repair photolyase